MLNLLKVLQLNHLKIIIIHFACDFIDTAGVHAELEKMTKGTNQKQTKRAHSDVVNPNGPSSAS